MPSHLSLLESFNQNKIESAYIRTAAVPEVCLGGSYYTGYPVYEEQDITLLPSPLETDGSDSPSLPRVGDGLTEPVLDLVWVSLRVIHL